MDTFHLKYLKVKDMKETISFVIFAPVPDDNKKGLIEDWMDRTEYIETCLRRLQTVSTKEYWCQVLFNDTLDTCITSFLRHVPRYGDTLCNNNFSEDVEERLYSLRVLFLEMIVKMSERGNNGNMTSTEEFGVILRENVIFDISKIFDFCTAYFYTHREIVEEVVNNIFKVQPKYLDDLKTVAKLIPSILNTIYETFNFNSQSDSPKKITQNGGSLSLKNTSNATLKSLISNVYATFKNLDILFEVYTPAAKLFSNASVLNELSSFYEAFYDYMCEVQEDKEEISEELCNAYCLSQYSLLKVFRQILFQSTLNRVFESPERLEEIVEDYLSSVQMVLCERRFVSDYFHSYPFEEDVEIIRQSDYRIDNVRHDYIVHAINDARREYACDVDENLLGACGGAPSMSDEIQNKIASVQGPLPHLDSSFVQQCLEYYKGNVEAVISAILEDNLPPHLRESDQSQNVPSGDPKRNVTNSHLTERRNVFDNDEFDAFAHKIDESRVHLGKRTETLDTRITDKGLKERIKLLNECMAAEDEVAMYDDEYDDSCDVRTLGKVEASSNDDYFTPDNEFPVRPLNERRKVEVAFDDEGGDKVDTNIRKNPTSFLEDPAVLRERAAQRRADKFAAKSRNWKNHSANHEPDGDAGLPRDVQGIGRGRGQSDEVVRNRAFKERNKSSRVNHNRKDLANKKQRF